MQIAGYPPCMPTFYLNRVTPVENVRTLQTRVHSSCYTEFPPNQTVTSATTLVLNEFATSHNMHYSGNTHYAPPLQLL